jgi:HSP20 family protein
MWVRWNPFEELTTLHREMDRLFGRALGQEPSRGQASITDVTFTPPLEVWAEKDAWRARIALPGVDPKNVEIDVTGNTLTIRGERRTEEKDGQQPYHSEFSYGRFERTITLPENLDADKVSANYRNGLLELQLPLKESAKPRRIQVTSEPPKAIAAA